MLKTLLIRFLSVSLVLISSTNASANLCVDTFTIGKPDGFTLDADPFRQWLLWEQKANLALYIKSETTVDVPLVEVPASAVDFQVTTQAPKELIKFFQTPTGNVLWAKHPYNADQRVPFLNSTATSSVPVFETSSRSLALDGALRGFTIKLATDRPHGPKGQYQPDKVKTNDDVDSALIHTKHLDLTDAEFGPDARLIVLGEVMTIAEKKTGIGMVVRDVRAMDDGHYYLPALSIPFVGREIARRNGKTFEEFFAANYAALLGEAKARLLLRTGLQMLTPNPQNMLIQLDKQLRPTGKIVFRDVSDAYLVDVVAKGLGFEKQIELDNLAEYPPVKEVTPYWSNSSWRFDEAGDKSVSYATTTSWGVAHDTAFVGYIKAELGIEISENRLGQRDTYNSVYQALASDVGQMKLRQYRERLSQSKVTSAAAGF